MNHYAAIDVSLERSSIRIVDASGPPRIDGLMHVRLRGGLC